MSLSKKRRAELEELEGKIGYRFQDMSILNLALTHSSYANEDAGTKKKKSNERLEFLGDAVMELIVSDFLYHHRVNLREGMMTKLRSRLVCEPSFAYVARKLNLGNYLLMGKGEEISGGRDRNSVLADAFEALCGAIYIDSDFDTVNRVLNEEFSDYFIEEAKSNFTFVDYKTKLQEHCQKKSTARLKYKLVDEKGPDHDKTFYMEVSHRGKSLGKGKGRNKKTAEQNAAKRALINLGVIRG